MVKLLKIGLALAVMTSLMIACAPTAEAPANTSDVSKEEMPEKLKGTSSENAGGGGNVQQTATPSSSPD